ncbi:Haloacid dehalogenase-like hydrolase [Corynebacterium kutscheri]|uniref:Haloacid dehalogenase superfamily protein, subfamily IA, variant 3 with third motif having DD or ED n=1 Tax=Corynebacterium kutscheri TaxID=35755 RepID=A0A0F6QZH1_9CORY|nr:HAD-IA family hydrolase [Corynebacterium kutscheri]AKE40715.1 haloacid dehalogenase superfamily protein, subfamily IA, variant 3 with third motif having DD or ED [Corynebacterium kutscheri]VEH04646.1 Haloacid dehalogenase-like hydrolase [Corynebacterium kutscheri]VEH11112.1 Haloacid dehalogenase-like hydrolase [Corynebacterium kutscheri]VEH80410.1 Haloacid dehalogenase-like hydrolase [Corynebacterium kutscheri]
MRGLIVDYVGVLDGTDDEQRRWRNLFASARAGGIKTAVLSNDPGGPGAEPIRVLQTQGIVDAVLLSGEIGAEKPDVAAFQAAADALDIPMNDCVMVDDSILNVRAAVESGLVGVYYQQFDRAVVEIAGLFGINGEF